MTIGTFWLVLKKIAGIEGILRVPKFKLADCPAFLLGHFRLN